MPRVILQPYGGKEAEQHFKDTVERPVALEVIRKHLSADTFQQLVSLCDQDQVATWGVVPGKIGLGGKHANIGKWENIEPGSLALFTRNKAIRAAGVVLLKAHSKELAQELWGIDENGQTWEYLYFLKDVKPCAIAMARFNNAVGTNFSGVMGITVMKEENSARVLASFDELMAQSDEEELGGKRNLPYRDAHEFIEGQEYSRVRDIHQIYGGSHQSGISPSSSSPFIFLFTGGSGHDYGYQDSWEGGVFNFFGEGQLGDMHLTKGNSAIRDHSVRNKKLLLFQITGKGKPVKYMGEFSYESHKEVIAKDREQKDRRAFVFQLKKAEEASPTRETKEHIIASFQHEPPQKVDSKRSKQGVITNFDAERKTILRMVYTVRETVKNANGQKIERTLKNKELRLSDVELETYIKQLLEKQNHQCAITGIPLRYDQELEDKELVCSLDRIDSNGHYEEGNLQVVCKFINLWKSDYSDTEFRRLLSLLRQGYTTPPSQA